MNLKYQHARACLYPEPYFFLEALYPLAGDGNATKKAAIDAHINLVNNTIPADSTEYTMEEIQTKLTDLKKDSAFLFFE